MKIRTLRGLRFFAGACLCLAGIFPLETAAQPKLKLIAEGLTSPVALVPLEDRSGRLLVVDQVGVVYILDKDGKREEKPFFDVRDRLVKLREGFDERGLLGLALHPQFRKNRKVYVYYSAPLREGGPEKWDHTSHVSEFTLHKNQLAVNPATEKVLLQIDQPQFNHNGGGLTFGPDGYLYIAVGDGGGAHDTGRGHPPLGNGQDTSTLLGSILRIDVNKGDPYGIPSDNPFAGKKGRDEIFAYGLRNVWGMSFDRGGKREFFAADVGQNMFEEVNIITKGGNYGWNIREGLHCFDPKSPNRPPEDCPKSGADGEPLLDPIIEYKNTHGSKDPDAIGICVIGGYVYRGKAIPQLTGRYVFGDWTRNRVKPEGVIMVATRPPNDSPRTWAVEFLVLTSHPEGKIPSFITAFGEDADGELYVLVNDSSTVLGTSGKVYKLVP